jgi:antitoxin component of RelBE/YafQ-DinJ toxin-antitoxin module
MLQIDDDIINDAPTVAKQLGVSKATLIRMRQRQDAGGLPFVKLSAKRIGYRRADVRAFLVARRVGTLPTLSA